MIRHLCIPLTLAFLAAVPVQAGESHNSDIGFSSTNLVKSSFKAGQVAVEIFAPYRVDVVSLLADVDLSKSAAAQSIADRVNEKRKLLYPDEEVILSIAPPQAHAPISGEKAGLVRALFWWNNTNCSTCYWYAQYTSTVATMFIADIRYGAYNLYDKVGSGNWVFRYFAGTNSAATRATYGSSTLRGFRGNAASVASKADIVMFFFN